MIETETERDRNTERRTDIPGTERVTVWGTAREEGTEGDRNR